MSVCFSDLKPWTLVRTQHQALSLSKHLRYIKDQSKISRATTTKVCRLCVRNCPKKKKKKKRPANKRADEKTSRHTKQVTRVSTVIDPATVKKSRREKGETRQQSGEDRSLTFLLSFVLLGFFLLFGYRLRHFPVTWKRTRRWKTMR